MKTQYKWEKPKLIVLGRGRPEEHVLDNCKQKTVGVGPEGATCQTQGSCAGLGQS